MIKVHSYPLAIRGSNEKEKRNKKRERERVECLERTLTCSYFAILGNRGDPHVTRVFKNHQATYFPDAIRSVNSLLDMASSLRSPAGKAIPTTQSILNIARPNVPGAPQCRSFSQASQRWAYKTQNFSPRTAAQPSMKVRSKDLLMHQLPNDIGLLPGTFVRPLWRDMPSVFEKPRDRLQMEWTWLKAWFQNFMR